MLDTDRVNIDVDGITLGDGPLRRTIERALGHGDVRLSKTDDGWKVAVEKEPTEPGDAVATVKAAMRRSGYNVLD